MRENTPAENEVVRRIRGKHTKSNRRRRRDPIVRACIKEQRQTRKKAIEVVNELVKKLREDKRGNVEFEKPNNVL